MVDMDKIRGAKAARDAEKRMGRRAASEKRSENAAAIANARLNVERHRWQAKYKAQRRAIRELLELLYFHGEHPLSCPWHDGDKCNCRIGRKIKKIKARLKYQGG